MPASQWGTRSAAKWERMASGIPIMGLAIFAAKLAPINACEVAVIITLWTAGYSQAVLMFIIAYFVSVIKGKVRAFTS